MHPSLPKHQHQRERYGPHPHPHHKNTSHQLIPPSRRAARLKGKIRSLSIISLRMSESGFSYVSAYRDTVHGIMQVPSIYVYTIQNTHTHSYTYLSTYRTDRVVFHSLSFMSQVPVHPRCSAASEIFLFRAINLWNSLAPEQKGLSYKMLSYVKVSNRNFFLRQLTC
jgi:hypothetical protein